MTQVALIGVIDLCGGVHGQPVSCCVYSYLSRDSALRTAS